MTNTFSPFEKIQLLFRYWWVLVLVMLIGALAGFGFSKLLPTEYETRAVISVGLDYTRTGILKDAEDDQVLVGIGDVLRSDAVLQKVQSAGALQGLQSPVSLRDNLFLEREGYRWSLRVRSQDPAKATQWSNLWADQGLAALQDAYLHALNADGLQKVQDGLSNCLDRMVSVEPAPATCPTLSLIELQNQINQLGKNIQSEKLASKNLITAVSFALTESAPPAKPVQFRQGFLILAGGFIGFIAAIVLLETGGWSVFKRRMHGG